MGRTRRRRAGSETSHTHTIFFPRFFFSISRCPTTARLHRARRPHHPSHSTPPARPARPPECGGACRRRPGRQPSRSPRRRRPPGCRRPAHPAPPAPPAARTPGGRGWPQGGEETQRQLRQGERALAAHRRLRRALQARRRQPAVAGVLQIDGIDSVVDDGVLVELGVADGDGRPKKGSGVRDGRRWRGRGGVGLVFRGSRRASCGPGGGPGRAGAVRWQGRARAAWRAGMGETPGSGRPHLPGRGGEMQRVFFFFFASFAFARPLDPDLALSFLCFPPARAPCGAEDTTALDRPTHPPHSHHSWLPPAPAAPRPPPLAGRPGRAAPRHPPLWPTTARSPAPPPSRTGSCATWWPARRWRANCTWCATARRCGMTWRAAR